MDADLLAERENRQKYDGGPHYRPETICHMPDPSRAPAYIDGQFDAKMELVQRYCDHGVVVDLCCAAGDHLELFRMPRWRWGIGVDFSTSFLHHARHVGVGTRQDNLTFLCANARDLPLATQSVDSLYCLSSLYCIPRVEGVIREVARVLHPGGTCVLEFGCHSLNTLVCNAYPELANVGHISVKAMERPALATGRPVYVANGRKRLFRLDRPTGRRLALRRFLARSRVLELLLAAVLLGAGAAVRLWERCRQPKEIRREVR